MKPLLYGLTCLLIPFVKIAQVKAQDLSIEEAIVQQRLADPEMAKMAYEGALDRALDIYVKNHPVYSKWPEQGEQYIAEQRKRAKEFLDGTSLNGTYIDTAIRDAGSLGNSAFQGKFKFPIPTATIEKFYKEFLSQYDVKGQLPEFNAAGIRQMGAEVLRSAQNPRDPLYERSRELVKRVKINPDAPYVFTTEFKAHTDKIEFRHAMSTFNDKLNKMARSFNGKVEDLQEDSAKMLGFLNGLTAQLITPEPTVSQKEARENQELTREIGKTLGAASALAYRFGDAATADTIQKMQGFAGSVESYFNLGAEGFSFADKPYAYLNVYAAIGIAALNLIGSQGKNNVAAQQMKILMEIRKAIEQLRIELHRRFDQLEGTLYRNSTINLSKLNFVGENLSTVMNQVTELQRALRSHRMEMTSGLRDEWLRRLTTIQNRCLRWNRNGQPVPLTEEAADDCRDQFAQIMLSVSLISKGPDAHNSNVIDPFEEFGALRDLLSFNTEISRALDTRYHPATWLFGASEFLRLFANQPGHIHRAGQSAVPGRDDLSLDNLVITGQKIRNGLESIALYKKDEGYSLRKDLFNTLLDRYAREVRQAIYDADNHVFNKMNGGPNPHLGIEAPYTDADFFKDTLNAPIPYCEGSAKQVETSNINIDRSYTHGFFPNPGFWPQVRDLFLVRHDITVTKSNLGFLTRLPRPMLWGLRMGHLSDLRLCFRQVKVSDVQLGHASISPNGIAFKIHIAIDVTVMRKATRDTLKVGTLTYDFGYNNPSVPVGPGHGCTRSIMHNVWLGQERTDCGQYTFAWPGVSKDPSLLKFDANAVSQEYKEFVDWLTMDLNSRKVDIEKTFNAKIEGQISAARALRLLTSMGLDPMHPDVHEFAEWLKYPLSLANPAEYGHLVIKRLASKQELHKDLDKRVEAARNSVEKLARAEGLRPRTHSFDRTIERLQALSFERTRRSGSWWWPFQ